MIDFPSYGNLGQHPNFGSPPGARGTFAAIGARGQIARAAAVGRHRVVQVAIPIRDLRCLESQAGGENMCFWLVVLTILKNMSSSMGRMISQYEMEHKIHVPNHQPA